MKNLIFILIMFVSSFANAQFFNNTNSELCFELYRTEGISQVDVSNRGVITQNVVYLVFDYKITKAQGDQLIAEWNKLTMQQKYNAVQQFTMDGRRVETEVLQYFRSSPPIFLASRTDSWENHLKPLNPKK